MWNKAIDLALLLAAVVGGALAWQTGRERDRLQAEYDRLARIAGDLAIEDPSLVHVLALETGEPLHFAWRVYFPPNYRQVLTTPGGGWDSSSSSKPREGIVRVRFREDRQGRFEVFTQSVGSSGQMSFGDEPLARLLRGRWDRVRVEQLGADAVARLRPNQSAVLLRLTLPEDLQAERERASPESARGGSAPVLYELKLGPTPTGP